MPMQYVVEPIMPFRELAMLLNFDENIIYNLSHKGELTKSKVLV